MPDGHNGSDLEEQRVALERLRHMLDQTKALYDSAREAFDAALAKYKRSGGLPPQQLMQAISSLDITRRNYSTALKGFNECLLKSVAPVIKQQNPA